MNSGLIAQSMWQENAAVPFLLDAVSVLILVILVLFLILFAWRLIKLRKEKVDEKQRDKNETILFSYLNEEITLHQVKNYLKENSRFIAGFVVICIDLQENLEGELEAKIQDVFNIEEIRSYFRKKLHSSDTGQVTRALIFFKHCHLLSQATVRKIRTLIHHQDGDVALASALALIDSKEIDLQFKVLQKICKREDITPTAVLELLLIFSETDSPDFQERGEKIMQILKSDDLPFKFHLVLIKGMGAIGFMNLAPQLFELMSGYMKKADHPNEELVGAFVEALGKLNYNPALPAIKQLIRTGNNSVCISCAKALGSLEGDEGIELLEVLFRHPEREVRQEAMIQLLKIGAPALDTLGSVAEHPEIEKNTLKEISEIREFQYD